ncbi:alanine--tRNA ligase [Halobacteriovorax sp. JY17]|uniref:alanine--tRNA ligase n=1 Tax=Halobacteriovorax sp. JY17 TaxID=2014617 RepID=UPI000C6168E3|nr:alanine--tRNA ligase [Halobacteriovorax sp. JY17]PIK14777.1 MAG: alanine--tRNA ligase [Halobacteriovorax sp. JY17]
MKSLTSREIREKFLSYFEKHNHLKIKASSVVPQNDPTLLFINSGMAPLKPYFLGKEEPPNKRLCNFQPCIRTKDIDDVGDRHHLTIFEMMGSWSIGDYYKDLACSLAYGLLVDELGFDPKRLYFTVYGGNESLGIEPDNESVEAWKKCGVPADHIVMLGDDNFWGPAGETGPCGPCTEVFFDCGPEYGIEYKPGGHFDDVSRYIEIWNAGVFMELNKKKDGSFIPLPLKSVDTGSGLERLAMVMNGHDSVYETDLMQPLMDISHKLLNSNGSEASMKKARMLTDHIRAAVFILSEGVAPSNEGQGYIPRRLIRKCVAALMAKKVEKIDFSEMVDVIVSMMSDYYPQIKSAKDMISYNLNNEINDFIPTVKTGLELIEKELSENKSSNKIFPGKIAFELVTTHGLPLDVLKSDLSDRGIELDDAEYEKCYEEHRKTSRVISRKGGSADQEQIEALISKLSTTDFVGYETESTTSKVNMLISENEVVESVNEGESFLFTTVKTPFYGESGGQVGDSGIAKNDHAKIEILDTMKIGKIHVHVANVMSGKLTSGEEVELTVDNEVRADIKRNHSATHLLHAALHKVVGKHAVQKGSLVRSDRLRFDFQNQTSVSKDDLDKIEALTNQWIMNNTAGEIDLLDYDAAIEKGAIALFGEKYDSKVRVIAFGENSVELCGGTHVSRTGDIGLMLITGESSVAKGIRRIEAVTGREAYKLLQERNNILRKTSELLSVKPNEFETKIQELKKKSSVKKEAPKKVSASEAKFENESKIEISGEKFFVAQMNADAQVLKDLGDQLLAKGEYKIICLAGNDGKTIRAFSWVGDGLNKKVKAGDLLKELLKPVDGKGGGKPHFAQGGSPDVAGMDKIFSNIAEVESFLKGKL